MTDVTLSGKYIHCKDCFILCYLLINTFRCLLLQVKEI